MTRLRRIGTWPLLAAFLALVAIPRLPTLAQPLLEKHPFRQTWTAYTALVYHEQGIDLLAPQLPTFGPPFFHPQEFPLFQALAALVMDAGVAVDMAMRITALACFIATAVALFGLVRRVAGPRAAWLGTAFFVASPFALVWSRASLIEYLATLGAVVYLWAGVRHLDDRRWWSFLVALAAGVIGVLVKPTTVIFCAIPLALYETRGWSGPRAWLAERVELRVLALGLVPALAAVSWTAMADAYFKTKLATVFLAPSNLRDYYLDLTVGRLNGDYWALIASRFVWWVVGVPFVPVLVVGLVVAFRSRRRWFWVGLAFAAVLPVLVFYGGYRRHEYYPAAITPELAAFLGVGGAWLLERAVARGRWATVGSAAIAIAALAYVFVSTADYWRPIYASVYDSEGVLPAARDLAANSDPGDLVVMVGRGWDPDVFYYARREGVLVAAENASPALFRTLAAQPYRVFFSVDPAHDAIDAMRWWTWDGAVSARTYEVGATPAALRRSRILSTDDAGAFDAAVRTGRALATTASLPCDGRTQRIPVDPAGTWLLTDAPPGTIVSLDTLEGPLPARRVFVLTSDALYGRASIDMFCYGSGSLSVQRAVAAPPPAR